MLGSTAGSRRGGKKTMIVQKAQATQLALVAGGIMCLMVTLVGYQLWSLSSAKASSEATIEGIKHRDRVKMASMGGEYKAHLDHEIHVSHQASALTGVVLEQMGAIDAAVQKLVNEALPLASESEQRSALILKLRPKIDAVTAKIARSLKEFEGSMAKSARLAKQREVGLEEQMHINFAAERRSRAINDFRSGRSKRKEKSEEDDAMTEHLRTIFEHAGVFFAKFGDRAIKFPDSQRAVRSHIEMLYREYEAHDNRIEDGGRFRAQLTARFQEIDLSRVVGIPDLSTFGGARGIGGALEHIMFFSNLQLLKETIDVTARDWKAGKMDNMQALERIMDDPSQGVDETGAPRGGASGYNTNPLMMFLEDMETGDVDPMP